MTIWAIGASEAGFSSYLTFWKTTMNSRAVDVSLTTSASDATTAPLFSDPYPMLEHCEAAPASIPTPSS